MELEDKILEQLNIARKSWQEGDRGIFDEENGANLNSKLIRDPDIIREMCLYKNRDKYSCDYHLIDPSYAYCGLYPENMIKFDVFDCFECSGLPNLNNDPVCNMDEGFLQGLFTKKLNVEYKVVEVDCIACGNDSCKFEITRL